MIDYKLRAAGEIDSSTQDDVMQGHRIRCHRCGKQRFWNRPCIGCEEIDSQRCSTCNNLFSEHTLGYGNRARRRGWYCDKNKFIICYPENDPVKQKQVLQTDIHKPRIIWEDIIETT